MDITKDNKTHLQKLKALVVLLLVAVIGIVTFTTPIMDAGAKTLSPIVDGKRETSQNASNAQKYSYLLNGNTNKGFLPDIKNLSKYGYGNKGWGINTPSRNGVGDGGRELTHSVYPSGTKFIELDGVEYLRITGSAVAPKYYHHTDKNHRVAILTREDGKNAQIKMWEAKLFDLTSSASYDYGYGTIDGNSDWRAVVSQSGHGNIPVHVTNDPYPTNAVKAAGKGVSKYFDNGYGDMFGVNSFNTNQVAKLCGLGSVGNPLIDTWGANWQMKKHGCNYIMDYTGFVVDIPVNAIISTPEKAHNYDFNIVMTMTTPNGKEARVYGQPLHIPGVPRNNTTVLDINKGYEGAVSLAPSDLGKVKYTPNENALRNFKRESNFSATHYSGDTNANSLSKLKKIGTQSFTATQGHPRFVGWGLKKFGSGTWNEIAKNKKTAEFKENLGYGRGEMWVGWSIPSLSKHKLYTSVGNAYDTMPSATMTYKPQTKVKPVVIRHRIISNGDYRNPGTVFKTETKAVKRSGGSVTAKPLQGTALTQLGSNMKYLGNSRVGGDPVNDAVQKISTSGLTLNNTQLFSKDYNGDNTLYIDFYYSGSVTNEPTTEYDIAYTVEHREKGSNKLITKGEAGKVKPGTSHTVSAIRPEGYVSTNEYKVDNGSVKKGTSYTIENNNDKPARVNVVFYYEQREMDIVVEHKNIDTDRKIAKDETGASVVIGKTYQAKPLPKSQLKGYTYSNRFSVNGGNQQTGSTYTVRYDDELEKSVVTFYYKWNEPEETTKRRQGDTVSNREMPVDAYVNAGLVTVRDAQGNVTGTRLEANTSIILDPEEAPIGLKMVNGTVRVGDKTANMNGAGKLVLNNKYLETVKVDSRIGNSKDAEGFSSTSVAVKDDTVNMTLGNIGGSDELMKEGIGLSGATVRNNEDAKTVGRWVNSSKRDMTKWTPQGMYSAGLTYTGNINALDKLNVTYNVTEYNTMRHTYESRVGNDGIEYYQYTGTDVLPGAYLYEEDGTVTKQAGSTFARSMNLDLTDMKVNEYVDSDGFNAGTGKVSPVQMEVAKEYFNDGNIKGTGYTTVNIEKTDAETVVRGTDTYKETTTSGRLPRVSYYEEFAYAPHHTEDVVITQQAVPVGGTVAYVNPYEYALLPSVTPTSVMEKSGVTVSEINQNVTRFKNTGKFESNVEFNKNHTGFYVSDKDEFETFSMASATQANKNFMETNITNERQYEDSQVDAGNNYQVYRQTGRGRNSRYTEADAAQSAGTFKYKQPVTYVEGLNEFLLEDVVAVGKDSGFPVVGEPETLQAKFKENYKREFGVEPSNTDKLITTNKGSVYLLPLQKQGQELEDDYHTRLFVNGMGVSQLNLVDDSTLQFDKYLYGRGENTIYSGQRQEVEVDGEFTVDQEIEKGAQPEKAGQVNGSRTNNNKVINGKVLDGE